MKNLPKNKVLLVVGGIVILLIIVFIATGALKFNFEVSKNGKTGAGQKPGAPAQQAKLAGRLEFGGTADKPKFSIAAPIGWAKGDEPSVDLAMGSVTPEKLPEGGTFTVNIVATIGPHPYSVRGISDYRSSWKDYMLGQYPSMEFVADDSASVGGLEAYVFEMKQTRSDGLVVHQIQYIFYINSKYGLGVTGSAPEGVWDKYKEAIRTSIESLELVSPGTAGEETGSASTTGEQEGGELVSYTNSTLGIGIMYPADWKTKEELQDGMVSFIAPSTSAQTVNIISRKLPAQASNLSLDEYTKLSVAQLEKRGAKISQKEKTTLAGLSAYKVIYRTPTDLEFMQVWTVKNGREYVVSYAAQTKKDYDTLLSTAEKMIKSFEID